MFYRVVHALVWVLAKGLWRMRIRGKERVPATGAFVLAPSHRSNLDSFFVAMVTRRKVRFMAKQEIWKSKALGKAVASLGAFPVDRSAADRQALRTAMELVGAGEPLVVFPEGTRRHGDVVEDLHDGAAYVAARHGVPIVPVGVYGTEQILAKGRALPKFSRVAIVVGQPIMVPPREGTVKRHDLKALTAQLQVELQKAFDEARAALS